MITEFGAEKQWRHWVFHFSASHKWAVTNTHSWTDPNVPLIKRNQSSASILGNRDGSEGKKGETCFHGFRLFLSLHRFPPLQQLISPIRGLRPHSASCAQQGLSHLVRYFTEQRGWEASGLLLLVLGQILPCVAPQLSFAGSCVPLWLPSSHRGAPYTNDPVVCSLSCPQQWGM